jgi:hypothetical protein
MDWTIVGTSALITLVALGAGWAWGTAYGYRKGMQGRPTLIDPISKFLKGQDEKQAAKAEREWQARVDKLRPPEVKGSTLMGGNHAQRIQANRPGRDPDTFGFIKATRKPRPRRRIVAMQRAPKGWRTIRVLSDGRRLVREEAPAKAKGKAATPGKPKAKARTARRPKARPGALQAARRGKLRRPRG